MKNASWVASIAEPVRREQAGHAERAAVEDREDVDGQADRPDDPRPASADVVDLFGCGQLTVLSGSGRSERALDRRDDLRPQPAAGMTASTEPTSTARWMSWMPSNSAATSLIFSARDRRRGARTARPAGRSAPRSGRGDPLVQVASSAGLAAVRLSTSPVNTTAAAGAPPMTEANEPSTASTVMFGLSALEKTTNAPPW